MPVAATFTSADFHGASLRDYFKIDMLRSADDRPTTESGLQVTLVDGSQFLNEMEKQTTQHPVQSESTFFNQSCT